jgi:hypothetical protein
MPHDVIMPALGMAQDTGQLVGWLKTAGDAVKAGDPIMEVETDKATMEVEAQHDGYLARARHGAGQRADHRLVEGAGRQGGRRRAPARGRDRQVDDGGPRRLRRLSRRRSRRRRRRRAGRRGHRGDQRRRARQADRAQPCRRHACARAPDPSPEPAAAKPPEAAPAAESKAAPAARAKAPPAPVRPASGGRILASPKARRIAAEDGLDLAKLVAHGVAQPFHMADLETLRALPDAAAATAPDPGRPSQRLTATVPAEPLEAFLDWLGAETGRPADRLAVLAAFAAASLRDSDAPLTIDAEDAMTGARATLADPDRVALGEESGSREDAGPSADLILRDLTATAITGLHLGAEAVPVLSLARDGAMLVATLEGAMDPRQAISLMTGFAGRLNPATEEVLASVASAEIADADAALDAAEAAFADWAARTPRERSVVLRRAWELMTARLDDFARLITLENGKARQRRDGRGRLCRRVLPLVRRGSRAVGRHGHACPGLGRAHRGAAQARRDRGAGHAVELPRRHGHPQDRPGAGRGLPGASSSPPPRRR